MTDTIPHPRVLLVEDDEAHAQLAQRALEGAARPELVIVDRLSSARERLAQGDIDLVLADLHLPDGSGLDLLDAKCPMVVLTSQGDEGRAVAAMKGGALDYCVKSPEMYRDLPVMIERALRAADNLRQRARAEASLRESDARFRQLASNVPEAFWLFDLETQRIVYASPAWSAVYAVENADDMTLARRLTLVHPEDRDRVAQALDAEGVKEPRELEFRIQGRTGTRWILERTFPIVDASGRPYRIAGLGADITRRRELEAALRQAQKMEAIGQLAGGVAHDFNNMLAAILSAAEELSLVCQTEDSKSLCDLIIGASQRAADLTRKLLSFSRKGRVRNAVVDLHVLVHDTIGLLQRSIDRRVHISTDLRASAPFTRGDAAELQNALLNLGINARDAMPNGGELHITSETLTLDGAACAALPFAVSPGPFIRLSVEDTGVGIPTEVQGRIFEPFFSMKEVGKGTGLGLAAVYGTMIEHHGAVTVSSEPGRGARFDLYLPLADGLPSGNALAGLVPSGKGTILLIDDEPLVLSATAQTLKSLGYEVVTARDGEEAVKAFQARDGAYVAIVCDLVMPRLSGADALARLRALAPRVPRVLCSGYTRDDPQPTSQPAADAFLSKPYHRADLAQVVARVIEEARKSEEP